MTRKSIATYPVLGIPIHVLPVEEPSQDYAHWLQERILAHQGIQVVTCNAEMIMLAQQDPQFAAVFTKAGLVIPDGAGVVWALQRQGVKIQRSPGIELAAQLMDLAAESGWKVSLIGGKPEISEAVLDYWQQRHPELSCFVHHGYFDNTQAVELLDRLQQEDPQLVLVGLGSPRQEYWIEAHRARLPEAVWMGVGGSFDIWAGVKTRAPQWWRDHQLEWLYRLYQEPWRWRRMLALPKFALRVLGSEGFPGQSLST